MQLSNEIGRALQKDIADHEDKTIINLASHEYFKAVKLEATPLNIITPKFFEIKNDECKIISFYAKKARGSMAKFIVNNQITKPDDLKEFDLEGYIFNSEKSDKENFVYSRKLK